MEEIKFNEDGTAQVTIASANIEAFKSFKTDADIAAALLAGAGKIEIPGEDATPEQLAAFSKAIGVPEKVEDYKLTFADDAAKKIFEKNLADMHAARLTPKQAQAMINKWQTQLADKKAELENKYKESEATLNTEWKTPEAVKTNKEAALKAAALLGFDKDSIAAIERQLGPAQTWIKFYTLSQKMKDTQLPSVGGGNTAPNYNSPEAAAARIKELIDDKAFAQKMIDKDPEALKTWKELHERAGGISK